MAAGLDGKEHLGRSGDRSDGIPYDDVVQLFREAGMWVVPTAAVPWSTVDAVDNPSALDGPEWGPFMTPTWRRVAQPQPLQRDPAARNLSRLLSAVGKLHAAGVPIAAGTDGRPWQLHDELELLVSAGLTPAEALEAATGVAARVLGAESEIGAVREGLRADLVLLGSDPIVDIRHTRDIRMVIRGGAPVDRAALLGGSWSAVPLGR